MEFHFYDIHDIDGEIVATDICPTNEARDYERLSDLLQKIATREGICVRIRPVGTFDLWSELIDLMSSSGPVDVALFDLHPVTLGLCHDLKAPYLKRFSEIDGVTFFQGQEVGILFDWFLTKDSATEDGLVKCMAYLDYASHVWDEVIVVPPITRRVCTEMQSSFLRAMAEYGFNTSSAPLFKLERHSDHRNPGV